MWKEAVSLGVLSVTETVLENGFRQRGWAREKATCPAALASVSINNHHNRVCLVPAPLAAFTITRDKMLAFYLLFSFFPYANFHPSFRIQFKFSQ